ncbi:MAG: diguanylate cyclase [Synechococcales cyanobacterium RM1_1_8]|nr:diguanylate cyclase [Synechococcales cyanobacterium RM1_1_8]
MPHQSSNTAEVVTLSLGVASMVPASMDQAFEDIVDLADQALYQAKEAGRNRIGLHGLAPVTSRAA